MILADTSVWVNHFRAGDSHLRELLLKNLVLTHPFIIGEIACGSLQNRSQILDSLREIPSAAVAEHAEVLHLLEERRLWGRGIGWVDAHLLASVLLSGCSLWTRDRKLGAVAAYMKIDHIRAF